MFQKCSKNDPKMSQKCRKNVPKMFQKCSKNVPKMSQKCSKNVPKMFQKCSKNVPKMPQKCSKNVPKMSQKCSKNVPKMFQKCSKNGQEMVKKCSTAHQLRQGANRLPPTIRCLGLLRFWLEKIIFFHLREQIFFWNAKLQGIPQNLMLFQSRILTEPEHFFMIECPPDFGFCEEERRKKKKERRKKERKPGKWPHMDFFFFSCVFSQLWI